MNTFSSKFNLLNIIFCKKVIVFFSIYLLSFQFILSQNIPSSHVELDFSAAETFYSLCEQSEPNKSEIKAMLNSKPYQSLFQYLERNWGKKYNQELYEKMLLNIFYPNEFKLSENEKKYAWIQRYFTKVRKNKSDILPYIELVRNTIKPEKILKRVNSYLPENKKNKNIPIYFIIGVNQGCASEAGVFIDDYKPTDSLKIKKFIEPWIAHEVHHFFRADFNHLANNNLKENHFKVFQALYWLETEGIAERVGAIEFDLDHYVNNNPNAAKRYKQFPMQMRNVQNALVEYSKKIIPGDSITLLLSPKNKPNIYHEMGHKMAFLIEKELGKERLIECLGKPLHFFEQYQLAARKANRPDKYPFLPKRTAKNLTKSLLD